MPPSKNRSEYVFVLDACSNPEFLRNTLDQMFVFASLGGAVNDNAKVILMNYRNPDGQEFTVLNSDEVVSLTNNVIFKDLDDYLVNLPAQQPVNCNWAGIIEYAVSCFEAMTDDVYIQTFFLVLISDFSTVKKDLGACIEDITRLDITFVAVMDKDVTYSYKPILYRKHLSKAMENIKIADHSEGVQYMYKFAKAVDGVLTGPADFLGFMAYLKVLPEKQDWKQKLTIGSYEFNTVTRKIMENPNTMVHRKMVYPKYDYMLPSKLDDIGQVDMSTEQEPVPFDKVVDAQLFHGQPVVIPIDVKKAMVEANVATFKILGFVEPEQLPEVYYGGEYALAVCADHKSKRAVHFLEFVRKVHELGKYAIAVRVYRARTSARLFVLIPQSRGWFLMANLHHGARRFVRPQLADGAVDVEKLSPGMATLRQHLLGRAPAELFHPRAQVSVHRLAVVDAVRRSCGYNTDIYKPAHAFDFAADISDKMKAILDTIFHKECVDSAKDSGFPETSSALTGKSEEMEVEEDDW